MNIVFTEIAWESYNSWLSDDRKMLNKINDLIKDITRNTYCGKGKPEPLKYNLAGYWSRRISHEHRLVYKVEGDNLFIISCKFHY